MKYELVILVTFACALIAATANPTKVCEPGTTFKKDCNECKCSTDGTDMACTRKICTGSEDGVQLPENTENTENTENKEGAEQAEPQPEQKVADESDRCTPGELFKKDCNDCTCPPSGLKSAGACTLLACFDSEVQKE